MTMKKRWNRILGVLLAAGLTVTAVPVPKTAWATEMTPEEMETTEMTPEETKTTVEDNSDDVPEDGDDVEITLDDKPYLALGADLTADQQHTVLSYLGVDAADFDQYDVVYVSNEEEHKYLDSYVPKKQIGTRALSSVLISLTDEGSGLKVSTYNINYCTAGMYKNALSTAGVQDANVIVAGPFPLSGTAALVGTFEAYEKLTGKTLDENVVDAAMDELVTTGDIEQSVDGNPEDVEAIVRPCGLGRSKAKDICACMKVLHEKYQDNVPDDFDALLALPGVGRKSANLIMGDVFGKPAIVTDTHCIRLVNRMGLVDGVKDPKKVEMALWKIIPPEEGSDLCHRLVYHGRDVCSARTKPHCDVCCLQDICKKCGV